jgi:hypothetical protein
VLLPSGWNSNADELSRGGAARDNRSRAFNRRFDGNSGGLQDMQPIATLDTIVPTAALGGERYAAFLGHPAFDLQGYARRPCQALVKRGRRRV